MLSFVLGTTTLLNAQVTIGSGETPNKGALLDLKQHNSANLVTSTKGLLLPKVVLKTTRPEVGKLAQSIDNTGSWDEKLHTGLLVYNVKNTQEACTGGASVGLYNWSGVEWIPLLKKSETPPTEEVSSDPYPGANCYLVSPGGMSVDIPIERAFKIWTDYAGTSPSTGRVLNLADVNNLSGSLTTNVVWQESNVLNATNPVTITGTGQSAKLVVKSGTSSGNALVNVAINGKVLWQWHIWVTNDEPVKKPNPYKVKGRTFWYMDRLLGATSNSGLGANGLYYQWGRHIPFYRAGETATVASEVSESMNLTTAIQSDAFMTYNSIKSHDWYSSTAQLWDNRWGDMSTSVTTAKSPFDPCPLGWRVASTIENISPWECLSNAENTQNIGTLALVGYRSNGDGSLGDKELAGYVWTASPTQELVKILYYTNSGDIFPSFSLNRANGLSVRCMKELQ